MLSVNLSAFKSLAEHRARWCVSLTMPAGPARLQNRKDTIRIRNLLGQAEKLLLEKGMGPADAREMLAKAEELISDGAFWRDQQGGLALFISPTRFEHFELDVRFKEYLVVARRFHLKPLIPAFSEDGSFYVLALSQNEIRMLRGNGERFQEIQLEGVPLSLEDALQYEGGGEQLQPHVVQRKMGSGGGLEIRHGRGSMYPDEKESILRFYNKLDEGVKEVLKGTDAPLVLAGVEYMRSHYEQVCEYPALLEQGLPGSPDGESLKSLYERGRAIVQPHFLKPRQEALERFRENRHRAIASDNLAVIVAAACSGQVETLLLREGAQVWGEFKTKTNQVRLHPERRTESDDLVDLAAVAALANGGKGYVFPAEDPEIDFEAAANFYYEVRR